MGTDDMPTDIIDETDIDVYGAPFDDSDIEQDW